MEMKYHELDADGNYILTTPVEEWKYQPYPEDGLVSTRGGIKVAWRTYATQEQAEACVYAAIINGILQANQGYDFGYLTPGDIRKVDNGFEVVIP